ncbi:MAG: MAPEG family protein [Pseudomonadota bacterium]
MTLELQLLVWAVALTFVQAVLAVFGALFQVGFSALLGNRENLPEITGWGGRAIRAHRNMIENVVLFAVLVLTAHAAGRSNDMTVLGAQLFFWARVAYVPVYTIGIPVVRTAVWTASAAGLLLIFLQLV